MPNGSGTKRALKAGVSNCTRLCLSASYGAGWSEPCQRSVQSFTWWFLVRWSVRYFSFSPRGASIPVLCWWWSFVAFLFRLLPSFCDGPCPTCFRLLSVSNSFIDILRSAARFAELAWDSRKLFRWIALRDCFRDFARGDCEGWDGASTVLRIWLPTIRMRSAQLSDASPYTLTKFDPKS